MLVVLCQALCKVEWALTANIVLENASKFFLELLVIREHVERSHERASTASCSPSPRTATSPTQRPRPSSAALRPRPRRPSPALAPAAPSRPGAARLRPHPPPHLRHRASCPRSVAWRPRRC